MYVHESRLMCECGFTVRLVDEPAAGICVYLTDRHKDLWG